MKLNGSTRKEEAISTNSNLDILEIGKKVDKVDIKVSRIEGQTSNLSDLSDKLSNIEDKLEKVDMISSYNSFEISKLKLNQKHI